VDVVKHSLDAQLGYTRELPVSITINGS